MAFTPITNTPNWYNRQIVSVSDMINLQKYSAQLAVLSLNEPQFYKKGLVVTSSLGTISVSSGYGIIFNPYDSTTLASLLVDITPVFQVSSTLTLTSPTTAGNYVVGFGIYIIANVNNTGNVN